MVAVIEDDCAARKAIGRLLRVGNYEPALFDCAEAFMTHPPQPSPACVIIDIQLPGVSGLDLQRHLRDSGSRVPVIFTTANRDAALRAAAELAICGPKPMRVMRPVRRLTRMPR